MNISLRLDEHAEPTDHSPCHGPLSKRHSGNEGQCIVSMNVLVIGLQANRHGARAIAHRGMVDTT